MMQTRREFLKALAVGGVAIALPIHLFSDETGGDYAHFKPKYHHGDYVECRDEFDFNNPNDPVTKEIIYLVQDQIQRSVPKKYRSRVRIWKDSIGSEEYPQKLTLVCWKYTPRKA